MTRRPAPFDVQADTFDQRAGIPAPFCQAIARAVVKLAGARPEDLLVEVGAGTGMLGAWLARAPLRYVGLDVSRGVLIAFHRRLSSHGSRSLLLQADADQQWPLANGAA